MPPAPQRFCLANVRDWCWLYLLLLLLPPPVLLLLLLLLLPG
jgi:hypothetical protein